MATPPAHVSNSANFWQTALNYRLVWLIAASIGIFGFVDGFRLGFGSFGTPGPGLWPIVLGVPTSVISLLLCVLGPPQAQRKAKSEDELVAGQRWAWATIAGLLVTAALVPITGLYLAVMLYSLFCTRIISQVGWLRSIAVSLAIPLTCYLIFSLGLDIRVPQGLVSLTNGIL